MWQLRRATARWALQNQKILTAKKSCAVTPFFKNVFPSSPSKWKRSSTRARDQKYQHKPKCGHICCVHTFGRDVDNPGTRFKFFFQHEINHSPLLFRRTHFLKHRAVTLTLLRRIWRPLRHLIVGAATHRPRRLEAPKLHNPIAIRLNLLLDSMEN